MTWGRGHGGGWEFFFIGWEAFFGWEFFIGWEFFFFGGEFFFEPLGAADAGLVDGMAVDDDVGDEWGLEGSELEVAAGGLQAVEHEAGGFGVHAAESEHLQDLHDSKLDGIGVFEGGDDEAA